MPHKGAKGSAGKGVATPTKRGRKSSGGITPKESDRINRTKSKKSKENPYKLGKA